MTAGTAIFLSAVMLGAVALYGLTMDRWDWRQLLLRHVLPGAILLAIAIAILAPAIWG